MPVEICAVFQYPYYLYSYYLVGCSNSNRGKEVYLKNPDGVLKTVNVHFSYSTAAILAT